VTFNNQVFASTDFSMFFQNIKVDQQQFVECWWIFSVCHYILTSEWLFNFKS